MQQSLQCEAFPQQGIWTHMPHFSPWAAAAHHMRMINVASSVGFGFKFRRCVLSCLRARGGVYAILLFISGLRLLSMPKRARGLCVCPCVCVSLCATIICLANTKQLAASTRSCHPTNLHAISSRTLHSSTMASLLLAWSTTLPSCQAANQLSEVTNCKLRQHCYDSFCNQQLSSDGKSAQWASRE